MLREMTMMNELDQLGLEVDNFVYFPQHYASSLDGIIKPLIIVFSCCVFSLILLTVFRQFMFCSQINAVLQCTCKISGTSEKLSVPT